MIPKRTTRIISANESATKKRNTEHLRFPNHSRKRRNKDMIVTVTCIECVKKHSTTVSQESLNQYHDGIPAEIAFYSISENARNLIVDKMCPTCWKEHNGRNE